MIRSLHLIRHGETAWSLSGRHTGRTDLSLTKQGEQNALRLGERLRAIRFDRVFTSPRRRALQTCELAGLGTSAAIDPDLAEWDYGDYEGLCTAEIHKARPAWNLFCDGCPGGEMPAQVSERADRLLARLQVLDGSIALFTHGHFGRVLAARWVGLPLSSARNFLFDPASRSILGYEHGDRTMPAIALWNAGGEQDRPPS